MGAIEGTELVAAAVGRWSPTDVAFVRELRFVGDAGHDDGRPSSEVMLRVLVQPRPPQSSGWPDRRGRFWEAVLRFRGVRQLQFRQDGTGDI